MPPYRACSRLRVSMIPLLSGYSGIKLPTGAVHRFVLAKIAAKVVVKDAMNSDGLPRESLAKVISRFEERLAHVQTRDRWYAELLGFIGQQTGSGRVRLERVSEIGEIIGVREWNSSGDMLAMGRLRRTSDFNHRNAPVLDKLWEVGWNVRQGAAFSVPIEVLRKSESYKKIYRAISADHMMLLMGSLNLFPTKNFQHRICCTRERVRNPAMDSEHAEALRQSGVPEWLDDKTQYGSSECRILDKIYNQFFLRILRDGWREERLYSDNLSPCRLTLELYPDLTARYADPQNWTLLEIFYGHVRDGGLASLLDDGYLKSSKDRVFILPSALSVEIKEKYREALMRCAEASKEVLFVILRRLRGRKLTINCRFDVKTGRGLAIFEEDQSTLNDLRYIAGRCEECNRSGGRKALTRSVGLKVLEASALLYERHTDKMETGMRMELGEKEICGEKFRQIYSRAISIVRELDENWEREKEESETYARLVGGLRRDPDMADTFYKHLDAYCKGWFFNETRRRGIRLIIEQQYRKNQKYRKDKDLGYSC